MNEFVCEECNRDFNSQKSLNMHNRAKHPEKLSTTPPTAEIKTQAVSPKTKMKKKISIFSPILYGLVAVFFLVIIIIGSRSQEIKHSIKLRTQLKTSNAINKPSTAILGPFKLKRVNEDISIYLSTSQIGLDSAHINESWVAGELSFIDADKLETHGNLKSVNELKDILKIDQPVNVRAGQDKRDKILEDYSFSFNFWFARGYDDGYWTESELDKTKYIKVDKPKNYYALIEYYTNKQNFNSNDFYIYIIEGKHLTGWYFGGFIISLLIFIYSLVYYLQNRI